MIAPLSLFLLLVTTSGCAYPLLLFLAILLHEGAHALAAAAVGAPISWGGMRLTGIRLTYDRRGLSRPREAFLAFAGILTNLIAACATALLFPLNDPAAFFFFASNLSLAALNLLPIRSLDGAVLASLVFGALFPPDVAGRALAVLSDALRVAFILLTIRYHLTETLNLSMLILSLYLCVSLMKN